MVNIKMKTKGRNLLAADFIVDESRRSEMIRVGRGVGCWMNYFGNEWRLQDKRRAQFR